MYLLDRSENCPFPTVVDELTAKFIERMVLYEKSEDLGWDPEDIKIAKRSEADDFRAIYGRDIELAARGCAQLIATDHCPLWIFNSQNKEVIRR